MWKNNFLNKKHGKKIVRDKSYLWKKEKSIIFEVYINTKDIITTESIKGYSTLKIDHRNALFKLPAYIRKKSKNKFTSLLIYNNISHYNYNSKNKKDINSNIDDEKENITFKKPQKEEEIDKIFHKSSRHYLFFDLSSRLMLYIY